MKKWILIILVLITLGGCIWWGISHTNKTPIELEPVESHDIASLAIFSKPLSESGIDIDSIGFTSFSPDGKYFMFVGFKLGATPGNQTFLVDLGTGEVTNLKGTPQRGFTTSDILELFNAEGLTLYDAETKVSTPIPNSKDVYGGALSPDGKYFIMNSSSGVTLYNFTTKSLTSLAPDTYDSAYSWFSDSSRILGFRQTAENLFEAGKGRELGIWSIDGSFTPVPVTFAVKSLRMTEWIVPDHIARVNAGYDDGSFDYIVNLDTHVVASLGDTSGSQAGGVRIDQKDKIMGLLGVYKEDIHASVLMLVDENGQTIHQATLDPFVEHEDLALISADQVLYTKNSLPVGKTTSAELVEFDFKTNSEASLKTVSNQNYMSLSLSPDKKTWILGAGKEFFVGTR